MGTRLKPRLGGAVYILPNLLTTGNLFFGYLSIVKSLQGEFGWACFAILLASIFDILDGRVARLTNGTSEFGVQYDSLCDLVSFGLAPAMLMYQYSLSGLGRVGWVICFLFLACGALRLARFNVQSAIASEDVSDDFTGLPIPMAAIVVATFVAFMVDLDKPQIRGEFIYDFLRPWLSSDTFRTYFLAIVGPVLASMMVSNVAYRSHKAFKFRGIKPFRFLALCIFAIGILAFQPEMFGFIVCFLYAFSGLIEWMLGIKKLKNDDDIFTPHEDHDTVMEPDK